MHQTGLRKRAQHPAVRYPHSWCLPSLSQCRLLCQKWDLFFIRSVAKVKSQHCWDSLVSQQMLMRSWWQYCLCARQCTSVSCMSKTVHQCILRSIQSNCCSAKLATSFLLSCGPHNSSELRPNYEISGIIQQHEHELQLTRLNNE